MKHLLKKSPYLLLMLIIPFLATGYQFLNERGYKAVDISTSFDKSIPFLPVFVIPYILWYGFIFGYLVYFCFKDTQFYIKTLIVIVVGELICFVIYFFFQTTVPRPTLAGEGVFIQLVQWIYTHDQPFNCFPSIHVLTTFTIMITSLHIRNKHILNKIAIQVLGTLIIVSTLFVKQHVLFDMMGAMVLVSLIYGVTFELMSFRLPEKSKTVYLKDK